MKIKRNVIFLTILPVVLGGYSLNAVAITSIQPNAPAGKSYTFAADFNYGYSDLGLYVEDSYNGGYTEYYMNLSPYINQDATSDFTVANPSISGQFTYNSSAEQTSTYAYGAYSRATYSVNNESFTLNLNSTNGEAGQVLLGEGSGGYGYKNMTVSTGISSYSGDEYQNFQVYSYGGATPNVTLTGSSLDCEFGMCVDGGSYYIDNFRPHDDPDFGINGLPELFSDIESFSFELFPSFDSVESSSDLTYQLEGASLSLRYAGHSSLPIDNTLPETLPTLAESTYGYLSLSFDTFSSDTGMYGSEVSIWDIQFTEDSPYYTDYVDYDYSAAECQVFPGCGASLYEIEKEMQLRDFFSSSYLGGYADIDYALTEFEALADGLTPDTPLLPDTDTDPEDIDEGLFEFTFDSNPTGFTFIDPDVAVGYDYEIFSGSNFISVLLQMILATTFLIYGYLMMSWVIFLIRASTLRGVSHMTLMLVV